MVSVVVLVAASCRVKFTKPRHLWTGLLHHGRNDKVGWSVTQDDKGDCFVIPFENLRACLLHNDVVEKLERQL